jgi:xylulokinase
VLVGSDVGSSGASAIAADESGDVVAEAPSEYLLMSVRPSWTEQDPENWWRGAKEALGKVTVGVDDEVISLGLAGQMHGSVFLDPSDEVIRPALLWNNQRTHRQCEEITEVVGEESVASSPQEPADGPRRPAPPEEDQ